MESQERLELAKKVAVELRARELGRHLEALREYYAATRDGGPSRWTHEHVERLAKALGVHANPLVVRPRGSTCCAGWFSRTSMVIAERALMTCAGCGREWVEI